ncbi:MAG: tRNA (N(6)-L-threonylcarbamoyladenosine(37)-C(2))-methylthiotransferase MtaB [Lachnospiraceae bacterium]|nr:tRNA (N(6)-L-threonylcarbamoyladenosine(37)-C(2))-methylthiotransferase MtaB [Lachnospiraceae bacterium]
MKKNVALHNLGCKVNAYELEAMQQCLEEQGYKVVPFAPGADIYIINTCTVTNIADRKSRQMLHKAKKMNPDAVVVATGCYVQAQEENIEKDESIDIVIGNNMKQELIPILEHYFQEKEGGQTETGQELHRIDINKTQEYEALSISKTAEHTRAYIKVQDGCNQFCSYCIIPYARGRVRSRRIEDVLGEVRRLADNGYKEVVLTGIHLSSYGVDFAGQEKESLLSLIRRVNEVKGIVRIRLGSLEPRIITEDFVRELAGMPHVCPHFHLSLQSGCSETLRRMNRRYTPGEYREGCSILRKYYQNPALTTDVIVGFPGETEEEFQESYEFVKSIGFYETHIFKYSRRAGTKAAVMEGQIPDSIKHERSQKLLELDALRRDAYMQQYLQKPVEVLFEEQVQLEGKTWWMGHTAEYVRVGVLSEENLSNCICQVVPERKLDGGFLGAAKVQF